MSNSCFRVKFFDYKIKKNDCEINQIVLNYAFFQDVHLKYFRREYNQMSVSLHWCFTRSSAIIHLIFNLSTK